MSNSLRTTVKSAIAKVMPGSARFDVVCALPRIEKWRKRYVGKDCPKLPSREKLYDFIQTSVIRDAPVDYLEFGVWKGETIEYWAQLNKHPDSRFYGFDTFTGLPEQWKKFFVLEKGHFDCGGQSPLIEDGRVEFIKGLFQESLDGFLDRFESTSQLLIHNDSDLYSSTLYVLTRMHDRLKPGTIIIFDEFSSVLNEFRAMEDYCGAYRRSYEVLGVTTDFFAQVAIRFLQVPGAGTLLFSGGGC